MVNNWVKVTEDLPPAHTEALVYNHNGYFIATYNNNGDGKWMEFGEFTTIKGVTHWQLLTVPDEYSNSQVAIFRSLNA